eukprot:TRINITY_DN11132_c0_g1_i1.p1 TRINITY_DN11132_c0_g1~~TRINITY_DN11132_c0_g1_i1.p1  ORF type:complete len:690 (+),score=129.83 TRINITY_DN11132_c0_g1_i1:22-2091(+)
MVDLRSIILLVFISIVVSLDPINFRCVQDEFVSPCSAECGVGTQRINRTTLVEGYDCLPDVEEKLCMGAGCYIDQHCSVGFCVPRWHWKTPTTVNNQALTTSYSQRQVPMPLMSYMLSTQTYVSAVLHSGVTHVFSKRNNQTWDYMTSFPIESTVNSAMIGLYNDQIGNWYMMFTYLMGINQQITVFTAKDSDLTSWTAKTNFTSHFKDRIAFVNTSLFLFKIQNDSIVVSRSDDFITWTTPVVVFQSEAEPPLDMVTPHVNPSGMMILQFRTVRMYNDVRFLYSNNLGVTWSVIAPFLNETEAMLYYSLTYQEGYGYFFSYTKSSEKTLNLVRFYDDLTRMNATKFRPPTTRSFQYAKVAFSTPTDCIVLFNNLHLGYKENHPTDVMYYRSRDGGLTFAGPFQVFNNTINRLDIATSYYSYGEIFREGNGVWSVLGLFVDVSGDKSTAKLTYRTSTYQVDTKCDGYNCPAYDGEFTYWFGQNLALNGANGSLWVTNVNLSISSTSSIMGDFLASNSTFDLTDIRSLDIQGCAYLDSIALSLNLSEVSSLDGLHLFNISTATACENSVFNNLSVLGVGNCYKVKTESKSNRYDFVLYNSCTSSSVPLELVIPVVVGSILLIAFVLIVLFVRRVRQVIIPFSTREHFRLTSIERMSTNKTGTTTGGESDSPYKDINIGSMSPRESNSEDD